MKRYYVKIPVDRVEGYLISGHFEGYVYANSEKDVKLKLQLRSIEDYLDFYVDDFEIHKIGKLIEDELEIEEMS